MRIAVDCAIVGVVAPPSAQPARTPASVPYGEGEQILGRIGTRRCNGSVDPSTHICWGHRCAGEVNGPMTRDKDFKALVRARMRTTGENYLTARSALLAQPPAAAVRPDDEEQNRTAAWERARRRQQLIVDRWFPDGRLTAIPARRKVRCAVLLEVLTRFRPGRSYPESEVSRRLAQLHEDYAYLRRELVAFGYLTRRDGQYRVAAEPPARTERQRQELPDWERLWLPAYVSGQIAGPVAGDIAGPVADRRTRVS